MEIGKRKKEVIVIGDEVETGIVEKIIREEADLRVVNEVVVL